MISPDPTGRGESPVEVADTLPLSQRIHDRDQFVSGAFGQAAHHASTLRVSTAIGTNAQRYREQPPRSTSTMTIRRLERLSGSTRLSTMISIIGAGPACITLCSGTRTARSRRRLARSRRHRIQREDPTAIHRRTRRRNLISPRSTPGDSGCFEAPRTTGAAGVAASSPTCSSYVPGGGQSGGRQDIVRHRRRVGPCPVTRWSSVLTLARLRWFEPWSTAESCRRSQASSLDRLPASSSTSAATLSDRHGRR